MILLLALICGVLCLGLYLVRKANKSTFPRGFSKTPKFQPTPLAEIINRDKFSKSKLASEIDVIVIGSGMAGLSAASVLAKCGKRVLVLEKHYVAGGTTHVFEEKSKTGNMYEFDTGLHYIGGCGEKGNTTGTLKVITEPNSRIKWTIMGKEDGNTYDHLVIGKDFDFKFRAEKV
jgi:all-trans-retinol 13,14-reductase